jgi:predicted ATPase
MIRKISIENFKNIKNQCFDLPSLTILTGLNSTGKSSIIQSILLLSKYYTHTARDPLNKHVNNFLKFRVIRNKYENAQYIKIEAISKKNHEYYLYMNDDSEELKEINNQKDDLNYDDKLYYLSANRNGQEEFVNLSQDEKLGSNGEYIIGYFESNKNLILRENLIKFKNSNTLEFQLNNWLKEILDFSMELKTKEIGSMKAQALFNIDGLDALSPFNVGAGNSYLAKILITSLMCKKDDTILIENPEIHLHPKAQSKLGEFFSWIVKNGGPQIILETHSEHLINRIRYQVFNKELNNEDVIIYYKESIQKDFLPIKINKNGHYEDLNNNKINFPSGFFDSTLKELLQIG